MVRIWQDPYSTFNFILEIDTIIFASFSEISGLETEVEVEEYKEGGQNNYVHQFYGPAKASPRLVLKRGMVDRLEMWAWYQMVHKSDPLMQGLLKMGINAGLNSLKSPRKTVVLYLLSRQHIPIRWWAFKEAFPVKWTGPSLNASASGDSVIAFESLELAHHGIVSQGALPNPLNVITS